MAPDRRLPGVGRLPLLLGLALLAGACSPADRGDPGDARFDPAAMQEGDRVGVLTVASRQVTPSTAAADTVYVGTVAFTGELTVSGRYRPHPDHPEVPLLCFEADQASAARIPRRLGDERRAWFCFSNQQEAVAQLAEPPAEGEATVVVDRYQSIYMLTDAFDIARFVRRVR